MDSEWTTDHVPQEDHTLRQSRTRLNRIAFKIDQLNINHPQESFNIQRFIENLKIVDKQGRIVSLIMNRPQEIVFHKLMECREQRRPARFICCKARQMGVTTLVEAFIFSLITRYANRSALVVAHSLESAQAIFAMSKRFHRFMAPGQSMALAVNNTRSVEYAAPHGSRLRIDSSANKSLGRGETLHYVHASEVAFWEKPEEPTLAINQCVPQHWDSLVFWESTANGAQNLFHRTWIAAERGESDMEPIFLSWKSFPQYSLPLGQGERLSLTQEETKYQTDHDLDDSRMKWACHTKTNQCHNSWDRFHQEYPVAAHLAFVFTGMPWFDHEVLSHMLENVCRPAVQKGYLEFDQMDCSKAIFKADPAGPLDVWLLPDPSCTYSLGMDVGEGVGADYTVIQVICNETCQIVARYRSNRIRPENAGIDAHLLGRYYNCGLLGIERNGPGLAALAVCEHGTSDRPDMSGYPNLYYHTITDRKTPEQTRRLGWITNKSTKEAMLSRLAETVAGHGLTIFCRETLLEMQGFVWDAERRMFRQSYKSPDAQLTHDDEIIALAIANEMRTHNWSNRFITVQLPDGGGF